MEQGRRNEPIVTTKDGDLIILINDEYLTLRMVINGRTKEVKDLKYNCKVDG